MITHLFGRLVRIEILPPAARVARRWDGSPQAHPVTVGAQLRRATRRATEAFVAFAEELR